MSGQRPSELLPLVAIFVACVIAMVAICLGGLK